MIAIPVTGFCLFLWLSFMCLGYDNAGRATAAAVCFTLSIVVLFVSIMLSFWLEDKIKGNTGHEQKE